MNPNMLCSRCKKRMAVVFIGREENGKVINEGLCIQCAKELGIPQVSKMLDQLGIGDDELESMNQQMMSFAEAMDADFEEMGDDFEMGGAQELPALQNFFQNLMNPQAKNSSDHENEQPVDNSEKEAFQNKKAKDKDKKKYKFLDAHCENLCMKAREGRIDNIIGREREIERVMQILNRRSKNNPCLIGEPGVGKTAVAEGIALRLAAGEVPAMLLGKELFLLDLTSLVAGTQFRGQFESRVKGLLDDIKRRGNVILFIDEVHSLVGAGDAEGSMNAANILKPALSRGEVQVIGATTFDEYRKHIEKDAALERRFQPVTVDEPTIADSIDIMLGIKKYYEDFHRVQVSDAIARKSVLLAQRYINDRFLPDKAIDLLDEACSCASLRNTELNEYEKLREDLEFCQLLVEEEEQKTENIDYEALAENKSKIMQLTSKLEELEPKALGMVVTEEDLAKVIELWTGIPASKIRESELQRVAGLDEALKRRIIGQDEAVELVAKAVKRSRVQISKKRRPASFIFVGPTGVGKTELVKVLSEELFDATNPLIRLDMSEFMEKHSVARIIGAPPGYVGYDEAGQLTEKVRRRPYSVVLFDEIEKAHPDVMNILLQILDEGKIADAQGRNVSFESCVIIMTSNAGSEVGSASLGFGKTEGDIARDKAMKSLSQFLRPEFLGRVDEIVVFDPLSKESFEKIAALMLDELKEPLADKGIRFDYEESALALIADKAYGNKGGARDLRKVIRQNVEDPLCSLLVDQLDTAPTVVRVSGEDGEIKLLTM